MSDDSPTLAHVFALSKKIELNMVEEKVVTSGFSRDITIFFVDNNPSHSLVVVVVGAMEVRYDPNQVPEKWVHRDHYLHSLFNNKDNFVGHVVVFIFGGIVHRRVVDGLWLMDLSQHKFNVIIVVGSTIHECCFDLYLELRSGCGGGRGGRGTPTVGAPPVALPPTTTEAIVVARIDQLEQRLATMASFQHRSHSGSEVPTSYEGDYLFYMASVA
jgi:hypothetical protein